MRVQFSKVGRDKVTWEADVESPRGMVLEIKRKRVLMSSIVDVSWDPVRKRGDIYVGGGLRVVGEVIEIGESITYPETHHELVIDCQVITRCGFEVLIIDQPKGVSFGWEVLQKVKDERLGKGYTAIEIYPPAEEVVNETNRRWLWVAPDPLIKFLPSLFNNRR